LLQKEGFATALRPSWLFIRGACKFPFSARTLQGFFFLGPRLRLGPHCPAGSACRAGIWQNAWFLPLPRGRASRALRSQAEPGTEGILRARNVNHTARKSRTPLLSQEHLPRFSSFLFKFSSSRPI